MTLFATPTVTVAGVAVGLAKTGSVTGVDELSIHWGRSDLFAQPTPADLACRLLETTADGRPVLAARTDLIGQDVVVSWTGSDVAGATVMFRGRITDAEAAPADLDVPGGGWFISLTASSREVEAANFTVPAGAAAWPAESFAARLARIVALLPARMFPGGVHMPTTGDVPYSGRNLSLPEFDAMIAAPVAAPSGNALDLLRAHAASVTPLPLVYDPASDGFTFAARRLYENGAGPNASTAGLIWQAGRGKYCATAIRTGSGFVAAGADLDGKTMPGGRRALVQPLESRITNVEVSYVDSSAAYAQKTVAATTADSPLEATVGRRTLSVTSLHTTTANAANLAGMYADLAGGENRQRRLAGVGYDTELSGGFSSRDQMVALLSGRETSAVFFIAGSWLPRAGKRPLVGIVGGTIRYAAGEWRVEGNATPAHLYQVTRPLTVAGSQAAGVSVRLADLDATTFGDAGYLEVGAGYYEATQPA